MPRRPPAPEPPAVVRRGLGPIDLALALAAIAVSLWVQRGALASYFSPDDVIYFERVQGLAAQSPGLWRWLSGHAAMAWLHAAFGREPSPYFAVNLALHGANVALLYAWVRAWGGGRLAATLAAALFGTSRHAFTVLAQVVTVADAMALGFMLVALLLALRPGRLALTAAFAAAAAAVLSKESVAALPLVLLLPWSGAPPLRARALRCAVLLVPGAAMATHVAMPGVGSVLFRSAYERSYGVHMIRSLLSFAEWSVDLETRIPDLFAEASPAWTAWLWVPACFVLTWLARRGGGTLPLMGACWWVLGLAPVLPLLWQRYTHYLYASLGGLAMAVGGLLEWALLAAGSRRAGPARAALAWGVAAALVAAHAFQSDVLLVERTTQMLHVVDVPFDPFVRKRELLRRMAERLEPVASRPGARVQIVVPPHSNPPYAALMRSVAGEGRGLRALFPAADSIGFVQRAVPGGDDPELFGGPVDGRLVPFGRGAPARERLARWLVEQGETE